MEVIRVDRENLILLQDGAGQEVRLQIPSPGHRERLLRVTVARTWLRFLRWLPGGWILMGGDPAWRW